MIILVSVLTIVIVDYNQTKQSYELLLNEKLKVKELIETFKETYDYIKKNKEIMFEKLTEKQKLILCLL